MRSSRCLMKLCQHGRRYQTAPPTPSMSPMMKLWNVRRASGGASRHMQHAFFVAMRLRERYFQLSARAQPDDIAKQETMKHATDGKEHPAVVAFHNNRSVVSSVL